jgi:hypothetical protein
MSPPSRIIKKPVGSTFWVLRSGFYVLGSTFGRFAVRPIVRSMTSPFCIRRLAFCRRSPVGAFCGKITARFGKEPKA